MRPEPRPAPAPIRPAAAATGLAGRPAPAGASAGTPPAGCRTDPSGRLPVGMSGLPPRGHSPENKGLNV